MSRRSGAKGHLWTLPGTQGKSSSNSAIIVVGCSHLSGLFMRSNRPRARIGFADRSQNTGARSRRSTFTGLSDPVSLTISPYYPSTFFASSKRLSAMPLPPKFCSYCQSPSSPRRYAPSCWPTRRSRAFAVSAIASAPANCRSAAYVDRSAVQLPRHP